MRVRRPLWLFPCIIEEQVSAFSTTLVQLIDFTEKARIAAQLYSCATGGNPLKFQGKANTLL